MNVAGGASVVLVAVTACLTLEDVMAINRNISKIQMYVTKNRTIQKKILVKMAVTYNEKTVLYSTA